MLTTRRPFSAVIAFAILIALAGAVGYVIGVGAGAGPRIGETKVFRDAVAYSGDAQISALVDGITYGVASEVAWVDATGSWHERGWPACVPARSEVRITFGGALVWGPTGVGNYRVLWVDCRK